MESSQKDRIVRLRSEKLERKEYVEYVDPTTGEVETFERTTRQVNNTAGKIPAQRIPLKTQGFTQVYHSQLAEAFTAGQITYDEFSLLMFMTLHIEWEDNQVYTETGRLMNIAELAKLSGKDKDYLSALVRSLASKGFVTLTGGGRGRDIHITLSRKFVWRGRVTEENLTTPAPKTEELKESNTNIVDRSAKPQNSI